MSESKRKSEALALMKRFAEKEEEFMAEVRKRIVELSKDKKLYKETMKELQKRFKIKK